MRLALFYGGLFVASGVVLLAIPNVLVRSGSTSVSPTLVPAGGPRGVGGAIADQQHGADLHQLLIFSGVALLVMGVASIALGWLVAGRVLRPLRIITSTARDISASNLHERLGLEGPDDEFRELGDTLDDLFGRLEASFESQRHFVANASHELRTPLTAQRALIQVALADPDATADTLRSTCEEVLTLGDGQERLIDALLTLARSERGIERWQPFDLSEIAEKVVLDRGDEADGRGIHIDTALTTAPATGDPSLVESLMVNLVDNALRHNGVDGRVEISTAAIGGWATVSIGNTGQVIPPEEIDRLFQPFQQLGNERIRQGEGHGIGLAVVNAIASTHGATLSSRARPAGGLDIQVTFPPT